MLSAAQWKVGDEIVLASTDYDARQAERRTIAAISGNKITLDKKLEFMHFGAITFDVDERGEVGLLTRNIKIQGVTRRSTDPSSAATSWRWSRARCFVEGVELDRMGQNLELARYPIHWHLVGDGGKGQYIRNAAIHDTYNRCVTVHGNERPAGREQRDLQQCGSIASSSKTALSTATSSCATWQSRPSATRARPATRPTLLRSDPRRTG